jgi:hypothetical protein
MSETARFQETLRRLAMIDEGFVEDQAGLTLDPPSTSALDPKTAALLRVGAAVIAGSPAPPPVWRSRSATTSKPRQENRAAQIAVVLALSRSAGVHACDVSEGPFCMPPWI